MAKFTQEKINQLTSALTMPIEKENFVITCHVSTGNTAILSIFNEHLPFQKIEFFYANESDEIFERKLRQFKALINKHTQHRVYGTKKEGVQHD